MRRRSLYFIVLSGLLASAGMVVWLDPGGAAAPKETAWSVDGMMRWQWDEYATRVPLPSEQVCESLEQAVALMNAHSVQAFGGEGLRFVLWRPGDAPMPGYSLNPAPGEGKGRDESVERRSWEILCVPGAIPGLIDPVAPGGIPGLVAPPSAAPGEILVVAETPPTASAVSLQVQSNTLFTQTSVYLWEHGYRFHRVGKEVHVFR